MMDFLVERLRYAQPDEIRVITRPEKRDVIRHCDAIGAKVIRGEPQEVAESLSMGLAALDDADEVLIGFPDSAWEPPDGFLRVLDALRQGAELALGLFRTPELKRSDVVVVGEDERVESIEVKPDRPSSDLIWGIAATRVGLLRELTPDAELGEYFSTVAARGSTAGVFLSADWLDMGTIEGLDAGRAG